MEPLLVANSSMELHKAYVVEDPTTGIPPDSVCKKATKTPTKALETEGKKKKAVAVSPKEKLWVPKYPWIRKSGANISCTWCHLKLDIKSIKDYTAHEFTKKHFEKAEYFKNGGTGTKRSADGRRRKKISKTKGLKRKNAVDNDDEIISLKSLKKKRKVGRPRKKPKAYDDFLSDVELDEKIEIKCEMDFLEDLDLDEELDAEVEELKEKEQERKEDEEDMDDLDEEDEVEDVDDEPVDPNRFIGPLSWEEDFEVRMREEVLYNDWVKNHILTGKYPPKLSKTKKRQIQRKSRVSLVSENGDLYFCKSGKKVKCIESYEEAKSVLATTGPFEGVNAARVRLLKEIHWNGITLDIHNFRLVNGWMKESCMEKHRTGRVLKQWPKRNWKESLKKKRQREVEELAAGLIRKPEPFIHPNFKKEKQEKLAEAGEAENLAPERVKEVERVPIQAQSLAGYRQTSQTYINGQTVVQYQQASPTIRQYESAGQPVFQYIPAGQPVNLGAAYAQIPQTFQYAPDGQGSGLREEVIMTINMVQDENGEMRMAEPISTSRTTLNINPNPGVIHHAPQVINHSGIGTINQSIISQPPTITTNEDEDPEDSVLEPESALPDNWKQEMTDRFAKEDENYELMLKYMETGIVPDQFKDKSVRRRANRHMQHLVQDSSGKLHYIHTRSQTWREVVRSADKALEVLSDHHVDPLTGFHCCGRSLAKKVHQNFYWRRIELDASNFIKACKVCCDAGINKGGGNIAYNVKAEDGFIFREIGGQMNRKVFEAPKLKVDKVMDLVGINMIGPLPPSSSGLRYVLGITDYHSMWVDFVPMSSPDSAPCIAAGIRSFLYRMGPPKKMFYESNSDLIDEINALLQVKFNLEIIEPFSPETAQAARDRKQDLKKRLEDMVEEREDEWEAGLEETAYELRTKQRGGTTAFFTMLGRHPNK